MFTSQDDCRECFTCEYSDDAFYIEQWNRHELPEECRMRLEHLMLEQKNEKKIQNM